MNERSKHKINGRRIQRDRRFRDRADSVIAVAFYTLFIFLTGFTFCYVLHKYMPIVK